MNLHISEAYLKHDVHEVSMKAGINEYLLGHNQLSITFWEQNLNLGMGLPSLSSTPSERFVITADSCITVPGSDVPVGT